MKKIAFISHTQFGYLTDYFYFSKYLAERNKILFICYDQGLELIPNSESEVHYIVRRFEHRVFEDLSFAVQAIAICIQKHCSHIFINYFHLCFLLRVLMPFKKMIFDVRSGSITLNERNRLRHNRRIRYESLPFKYITVLNDHLRKDLQLDYRKTTIIPLGAELVKVERKTFGTLKLLYIGTLDSRRIHETIEGLRLFLDWKPDLEPIITYDVVGFGAPETEKRLLESIASNNLTHIVKFHGRKSINGISEFYRSCNIGIVYVPKIPAYEYQQPTKMFEAFFNGMPVIATNTMINSTIVDDENGVLITDTPDGFQMGLREIYHRRNNFDSFHIKDKVKAFSWEVISSELASLINRI